MKMCTEYTCPLELMHDMDQGKMETDHPVAAAFRGHIFGEAGTGHRRRHTEDAAGAVKRTDGLWICGKEIL